MTTSRLHLSREQILGYRRGVTALDQRLPPGPDSLRQAARAGLADSMPRAALLSIHARVEGAGPSTWEDDALVQVWGPRFSSYVVASGDHAVFTVGRTPDTLARRRRGEDLADALEAALGSTRMPVPEAARAIGKGSSELRYATVTGRILIRWDGARQPHLWVVPRPDIDPYDARLELARRFLHALGPGSEAAFGAWAGIRPNPVATTFRALRPELTPVSTPVGEAWILSRDEARFRAEPAPPAAARLLPSGDTFFLLHDEDRSLLVPDGGARAQLWPSRVWPGALLVDGEVVGTWRRAQHVLTAQPWTRLSARSRRAIEAEAASLPLPGVDRDIQVRWPEE